MGIEYVDKVTDKDLENAGVSRREFQVIKKLMKLDKDIFKAKEHIDISPYTYTVDLSKFDREQIPLDIKELLFRPTKMRRLYESYWALASAYDHA